MPKWRALLLSSLVVVGCGRTGIDALELDDGIAGDSSFGGSSTRGGVSARAGAEPVTGTPNGGGAGKSVNGGAAGNASGGGEMATGGSATAGGTSMPMGGTPSGESSGAPTEGGGEPGAPIVTELALGAFHSCAGFDDGSLRCWGSGGYVGSGRAGVIGDDETPDTIPPVDIGGAVKQISASWYHTCALLESGKVRCFGNGSDGMLGYGSTRDIGNDEPPAAAGNVNVGGNVLQISVGPYHSCAVLSGGRVRCWGKNVHAVLGYESPESIGDDEVPASAPFVQVGGVVTQVAAGWEHTCALLDTGKVRCWGKSLGGCLGYGNDEIIGDDETPASAGDVDVGGSVKQIVTGMMHTCALLDTGKVRCWGAGYDGRLGYGNIDNIGDDETPASAGDVDVGGAVKMLAAGDYATCALLTTGKVRCWGSFQNGELGYANTRDIGDDETPASAGDIDVGGPVTQIDAGFLHVCAILESGGVRCWGRASTGALGYGNIEDIGDDESPAAAGDLKLVR